MQLREMRFAKIEGTEVSVQVRSSAEAKLAIKELRHKKKEIALLKRRIAKDHTAARRIVVRHEADEKSEARRRGVFAALKRVSKAFKPAPDLPDLAEIQRSLEQADEILHNIDSCIIQLEGRLLS